MEKQSEHFDDLTRKWIKEGGTHSAPPDFMAQVMQKVEAKQKVSRGYRPLISFKGWTLFGLFAIACAALFYFFPAAETQWLDRLQIANYINLDSPLSDLKLSKTFIYGIGFLALFLLQIPLLKKYAIKNYQ